MRLSGWLLDLYEDPLGGVSVWFLNEDGRRQQFIQRFPVRFYASGQPQPLQALEGYLDRMQAGLTWRYTSRYDVAEHSAVPVLEIEAARPVELSPLFWQIQRAFPFLTYHDVDIPLAIRYAAETGVNLLCQCELEVQGQYISAAASLESPWQVDASELPLRVMQVAPECDPFHRAPRFLTVTTGGKPAVLYLQPERAFLISLQALVSRYDPDLILSDWGDTWLLPLILAMAERVGLALRLNRDGCAPLGHRAESWHLSYGAVLYKGEQVTLAGRWHIDRKNATMYSDYQLEGTLESARVSGLPLQQSARTSPGTAISAIQMRIALARGVLVPWKPQGAESPRPAADLFYADQGGLIYQPIPGVHYGAIEADYSSMFPMLMVRARLDPSTIGVNGPDSLRIPETNLYVDQGHDGVVPLSLIDLVQKRMALKQRTRSLPRWDPEWQKAKYRANALKTISIVSYGYTGFRLARFGRIEVHQAVTALAREAILLAKEAAEELGYQVLAAYIDSLTVKQVGRSRSEDARELLAAIEARAGLPIALEGIYRWVVYLTSRVNDNRSVANRYFGVFQDGEIKVRGIAARRKDTTPYVAEVQLELIGLLASMKDPLEALPLAVQRLRIRLEMLRAGRVAPEKLVVAQRLTREVENYASPSPAARAAAQLLSVQKVAKPGQRVKFLFTLGRPGVWAWDLPGKLDVRTIDTARYATLLLRAADEVLRPFSQGAPLEDLLMARRQPELLPENMLPLSLSASSWETFSVALGPGEVQ